jgi:hypothetical protein
MSGRLRTSGHVERLPVVDAGEALALARAVSRGPTAKLLRPDNRAAGTVSLAVAVASGQAYFVTPRAELCVIDADLPPDPVVAAARRLAFDLLVETADRCGVPHAVVSSGRAQHTHAYLVLPPGNRRATVESWCRDRGLDIRDRGIRPPGAPHRDGVGRAELLTPTSPAAAAELLGKHPLPDPVRRLAHALTPVVLPPRVRSVLRHGHGAAGYESPSHARMATAVAIRAQQGPRSLLTQLLADTTSPLGETFRARAGDWQIQEVSRLWEKAGTWLRVRPSQSPVDDRLYTFRAAVAGHRWRGLAGGTDLAVLEAFAVSGCRAGTLSVGMALSDLGIAAGVSRDTARSSVRRLLAEGWLLQVAAATVRTSRVYQLRIPGEVQRTPGAVPLTAAVSGDLGADVARWRGLGKLTMRIARTVEGLGRAEVAQLTTLLGMTPGAVRYHLRKLARVGLAAATARCWVVRITAGAAERVSVELGVAGARDRQRLLVSEVRTQRAALLAGYVLRWQPVPPGASVRAVCGGDRICVPKPSTRPARRPGGTDSAGESAAAAPGRARTRGTRTDSGHRDSGRCESPLPSGPASAGIGAQRRLQPVVT